VPSHDALNVRGGRGVGAAVDYDVASCFPGSLGEGVICPDAAAQIHQAQCDEQQQKEYERELDDRCLAAPLLARLKLSPGLEHLDESRRGKPGGSRHVAARGSGLLFGFSPRQLILRKGRAGSFDVDVQQIRLAAGECPVKSGRDLVWRFDELAFTPETFHHRRRKNELRLTAPRPPPKFPS